MNNFTEIPAESGIYFIKDGKEYLYIGKTLNLKKRLNNGHHRIKQLKDRNFEITYELYAPEEIREKEKYYIEKFRPFYNNMPREGKYKSEKDRKSLFLPPILHRILKLDAERQHKTMNNLLEEILRNYWKL